MKIISSWWIILLALCAFQNAYGHRDTVQNLRSLIFGANFLIGYKYYPKEVREKPKMPHENSKIFEIEDYCNELSTFKGFLVYFRGSYPKNPYFSNRVLKRSRKIIGKLQSECLELLMNKEHSKKVFLQEYKKLFGIWEPIGKKMDRDSLVEKTGVVRK